MKNKFEAYEYETISDSVWATVCIKSDRSWGPAFMYVVCVSVELMEQTSSVKPTPGGYIVPSTAVIRTIPFCAFSVEFFNQYDCSLALFAHN
jgi:hypothetical protein